MYSVSEALFLTIMDEAVIHSGIWYHGQGVALYSQVFHGLPLLKQSEAVTPH